jgi:hypothetical protein
MFTFGSVSLGNLPLRFTLAALCALVPMVSAAHADTVYSNMTGFGCGCGPLIDESQSLAGAFTPNANYSLTDAQAQLEGVDLGTPDIVVAHSFAALDSDEVVDFALYSDAGGVPGVSLATLGSASFSNSDEGVYSVTLVSKLAA